MTAMGEVQEVAQHHDYTSMYVVVVVSVVFIYLCCVWEQRQARKQERKEREAALRKWEARQNRGCEWQ
jgi:hypothetical protein